jgi:hypothetical protein
MRLIQRKDLIVGIACLLTLGPAAGWGSHVFNDRVSGEITATPVSSTIEVDHHVYHIKVGSTAAQALHGFSEGQKVELVLDGPPGAKSSEVLMITLNSAS